MLNRKPLSLLVVALLCFSALPSSAMAAATQKPSADVSAMSTSVLLPGAEPPAATGHVVLSLHDDAGVDGLRAAYAAVGADASDVDKLRGGILTLALPDGMTVDEAVAALRAVPAVEWAEPDYAGGPTGYTPPLWSAPNDPSWVSTETWTFLNPDTSVKAVYANGRSWWLRDLRFPELWQRGHTGPDIDGKHPLRASGEQIRVAVLDSGLYPNEDLGNIVGGWDAFESYSNANGYVTDYDVTPANPYAPSNNVVNASHGTCVSGEIAAAANNALGVTGGSWDGQVVVYKIAGYWEDGDPARGIAPGAVMWFDSAAANAMMRAADDGAKVISISAGWMFSQALQDAANYAHSKGAIVVAAAGNSGYNTLVYPAGAENVVGVGSYGLDPSGQRLRSTFSNYGLRMDVVAPGEYIYGLYKPGEVGVLGEAGYSRWTGTSMSTPIVSAVLSYLWRAAPGLTNDEVWEYARRNADDMMSAGFDGYTGYGAIDPVGAYDNIVADYPILSRPTLLVAPVTPSEMPVAWTPVPGRSVRYDVLLDGSVAASGVADTNVTLYHVAEGPHELTVRPRSDYNWSDSSSLATASVEVTGPITGYVERVGGSDRYRVSAALSAKRFTSADRVVLVSGTAWPDALSAAPLATEFDSPVLLTRGDTLSPATSSEIKRLNATRVTIVGGTGSVSTKVVSQLRGLGVTVDRIAGTDRYETAARVATKLAAERGSIDGSMAVVANGERFGDAIAASAVAARKGWPLLLVRADGYPQTTAVAVRSLAITSTLVAGTPSRVSNRVLGLLPHAERVAGATDASVPSALDTWARAHHPSDFTGASYVVVSSTAFADGLSAAAFAARDGALILETPNNLNAETAKTVAAGRGRIAKVWIAGGTASVSTTTEQLLGTYLIP